MLAFSLQTIVCIAHSELVGDGLENDVEDVLCSAEITFWMTNRAKGFDQAPDFIIPSEFNPQVIIEAKNYGR